MLRSSCGCTLNERKSRGWNDRSPNACFLPPAPLGGWDRAWRTHRFDRVRGFPIGAKFLLRLGRDTGSLISTGHRGPGRPHRKHPVVDAKAMEAMCPRRHSAGRLLIVAFDPVRFVRSRDYAGDVIHFIAMKSSYDRTISALPAEQRPRLFDWGGMSFASHGLIYDETDQVALPRGRQSADWLAQASHTELSGEGYGVRALWDHYYLADFPC
jgi:hypothetical protein